MGNIFYVLKIGIVTLVIVLIMQINIGQNTVENHAEMFIRKSSILEPVREVAEGGFIVLKNVYRKTASTIDTFVTEQFRSENAPGKRKLFELKRSLAYQKDQEKRLEEQSQENEESEDLE